MHDDHDDPLALFEALTWVLPAGVLVWLVLVGAAVRFL